MQRNHLGPGARRAIDAARKLREQRLQRPTVSGEPLGPHRPRKTGLVVHGQLPSLGGIIQDRLEGKIPDTHSGGVVGSPRLSSIVPRVSNRPAERTVGQFYEERRQRLEEQQEAQRRSTVGQFYEQRQLREQTTGQEYRDFDAGLVDFIQELSTDLREARFAHRVDPSGAYITVNVDGEEVIIRPHREWDTDELIVVVDSGPGTRPVEMEADPVRIVSFLSEDVNYPVDEEFGIRRSGELDFEPHEGIYSPLNVGAPKTSGVQNNASKIAEQVASELSGHQGIRGVRVAGVTLRGNHVDFSCDNVKARATVAITPERLVKVTLSGPKIASSAAVITDIAHIEPQKIAEKIVGRVCGSSSLRPTVGNSPLVNKSVPTVGRVATEDAVLRIGPNALELALLHAQDIKNDDSLRKYALEIISLGRDGVSKVYVDKKKEALFHTDWDGDPTSVITLDEDLFLWLAEWSRDIAENKAAVTDLVDAAWYRAENTAAAARPLRVRDFAALVELAKKLPPKKAKKAAEKKPAKKKARKKPAKRKATKKAKKAPKKPAKKKGRRRKG